MTEKKEGDDYREGLLDGDQRFQDNYLKMSDEHWKKEDPEFHEMMMKHRKANATNKK